MRSSKRLRVVTIALGLYWCACSSEDGAGGGSGGGTGGAVSGGGAGGSAGTSSGGTAGSSSGGSGGIPNAGNCTGATAAEIARVQTWLTDETSGLPDYAYANIQQHFGTPQKLEALACSIAASCAAFAPSEDNWLEYCEAVITSAIVAESSYDPTEVVLDSYGTRDVNGTTANDPTVGLLQIRFSSTVNDFNYFGPLSKLTAIGCAWPAELPSHADDATFWATAGGTTYASWMQTPACNIAQTPIYTYQYCNGEGIAGNMVVGLLSHLQGPGFPRPPDATNPYVTGIKSRFVALLGGTLPSPDPFTVALAPEVTKYCK
jgi:hypothetical protein